MRAFPGSRMTVGVSGTQYLIRAHAASGREQGGCELSIVSPKLLRAGICAAALFALTACAELPGAACPAAGKRATAELLFGQSTSDPHLAGVSDAEFTHFLDREVSPRFPDGLTVIDAQGRWTGPGGLSVHEPSKMVMIVLPGRGDDSKKLDAVREAYKTRYHQESVLLMTHGDCVSF